MDRENRSINYLSGIPAATAALLSDFDADFDVKIMRTSTELVSWSILSDRIASGRGASLINVGDKIPVTLKNGDEITLVAVHADPYWRNSMAFSFDDCLSGVYEMNHSGGYQHGYETCDMRKYLTDKIFPLLPDELAAVIRPRTIRQKPYDGQIHEFSDRLWLMSQTEVFGFSDAYRGIDIGDIPFDYYKKRKNRIKTCDDAPYWWWLRTPLAGRGYYVRYVYPDGSVNYYIRAYNSNGVAPACIIGAPEPVEGR